MNTNTNKTKQWTALLRIAAYLLAVTLVFSVISVLCNTETSVVLAPENGILDLTGMDFNGRNATIAEESFTMYPSAFYLPEEFAAGKVTQADIHYNSNDEALGDYGTLRLELRLPPGAVYAITGRSVSYAQRLFIDGKEYPSIGKPGTSADAVVPKSMRYMEAFAAPDGSTEIVIHYSAFVHTDGGGLYPLKLGLARNIARTGQLDVFRIVAATFALITAMLFFFGLFLFFGKSRYVLWFSLVCGCIALRGLLTGEKEIMILLPDLDWYFAIRMEYITTCGMSFFSALYLSTLFPGAANKWAMRGYTVFCTLNAVFICVTLPLTFTRYAAAFTWSYVLFNAWLLVAVLISVLHKKRAAALSATEQLLLLAGFIIYLILSMVGIYAHRHNIFLLGLDYPQVGMMVFLFINILALALGFARTERELEETRRNEREVVEANLILERLDRAKTDFLQNISHELKTPLTVISNSAGLTLKQIRRNAINAETEINLDSIQNEAVRLGDMVALLMKDSLEKERRLVFTDTDAAAVLRKAADFCEPICRGNGNRIVVRSGSESIPLRVNADSIFRVLINLITNANKHTQDGEITLNAEANNEFVILTVKDDGEGIAPALIASAFNRGVSGSGGTGLGLAICKEIVEEHGGEISIQSETGKGAAVRFTLPCAVRSEAR